MTELTALPATFSAGTTVKYTKSFTDYPADAGWAMTLYLAGKSTLKVVAVANGAAFDFTITADDSAALEAGVVYWIERASKADDVRDADKGSTVVTANLATATGGQAQSWAERNLALVEAALEGRIPRGFESTQIDGRAISRIPIADLYKLRSALQAEVAQQRNPEGFGRPVLVHAQKPGWDQ